MMLPCRGLVRGTQMTTDSSGSAAASSLVLSSRAPPPIVSLATTRTRLMAVPPTRALAPRDHDVTARSCVTPGRLLHAISLLEDPVPRAGPAVLIRPADDGRDVVEVEDRRRRGDLPLERERAPRVRRRPCAAAP